MNRHTLIKSLLMSAVPLLAGVAAAAQPGSAALDGKALFNEKCAMCHNTDGTGKAAMKVDSFKTPDSVKKTDAQLIAITADGKGKMPPYKGKLSDAQISDLVKYIRTLQK